MKRKLSHEEIKELQKLEKRLDEIGDFTAEYEEILYRIAEFCVENDISSEEYDALLGRDAIC